MEGHSVPHPDMQTAACRQGRWEEMQRCEPPNRRAGRTRPQIGGCVVAGFCPARTARSPIPTPALPWRIAEIDGDHGLSCRRMAIETVGLEPPLLDCGNRRPAENKIPTNNFQILDVAIASTHCLQYHRSLKFLPSCFGWLHRTPGST